MYPNEETPKWRFWNPRIFRCAKNSGFSMGKGENKKDTLLWVDIEKGEVTAALMSTLGFSEMLEGRSFKPKKHGETFIGDKL